MAIVIPSSEKEIAPIADQSVGRIDATAPNGRQDVAMQQNAIEGVGKDIIQYQNQVAAQTAQTIGTDQTNKLQSWVKSQIYGDAGNSDPSVGPLRDKVVGLKYMEGDPDKLYQDFEKRADAKMKELGTSNDPDNQWSTETQNTVNRLLGRKAQEMKMDVDTQYGSQKHTYDTNIHEVANKQAQDAMPDAAKFIDPDSIGKGDMSTLQPMKDQMANIANNLIGQAIGLGGAAVDDEKGDTLYRGADGVPHAATVGPQTKQRIKEETAKGLFQTMDLLNKLGENDPQALAKAQILKDNFGKNLDTKQQMTIAEGYDKAETNLKGLTLAQSIAGKSPEQAKAILATEPNIFVRQKAEKDAADDALYMGRLQKQRTDMNYQAGYQAADTLLKQNPIMTWAQAQRDPQMGLVIRNTLQNATPPERRALESMFDPPKVSDPTVISNMMNIVSHDDPKHPNGFVGMSAKDFNLSIGGASRADQTKYTNLWIKANQGPSGQQMQQNIAHAMTELTAQGPSLGVFKYDNADGTKVAPGRANDKILTDLKDQLNDALVKNGPQPIPDMRKTVHDFLINHVKGQAYSIPAFQGSGPQFGGGGGGGTPPPPAGDVRKQAWKDFVADPKNKGVDPNNKQLTDYINQNATKYQVK